MARIVRIQLLWYCDYRKMYMVELKLSDKSIIKGYQSLVEIKVVLSFKPFLTCFRITWITSWLKLRLISSLRLESQPNASWTITQTWQRLKFSRPANRPRRPSEKWSTKQIQETKFWKFVKTQLFDFRFYIRKLKFCFFRKCRSRIQSRLGKKL